MVTEESQEVPSQSSTREPSRCPKLNEDSSRGSHGVLAVQRFVASWRFGAMALGLLSSFQLTLVALLLLPLLTSTGGSFAEEFRVWCFGYDPATGSYQWISVVAMLSQPLLIGGIVLLVWFKELRRAFRQGARPFLPYLGTAVLITATVVGGLVLTPSALPDGELPFPAERLRTAHQPPHFQLTDHTGKPATLADEAGHVVIVTAVYASCPHTCPLIMNQLQSALRGLTPEEQKSVHVMAITLNPKVDDVATLADLAKRHEVSAPQYRFLTGPEKQVNEALDKLQIARQKNPETGMIDHANLFFVIDRSGRIAYRLTLGERQERWLTQALKVLVREHVVQGA